VAGRRSRAAEAAARCALQAYRVRRTREFLQADVKTAISVIEGPLG
jgi:hypothetical protein